MTDYFLIHVGGSNDRQLQARRRVHKAMAALGGISSPGGSCVWHVVGLQCSVREWAMRQGWGGRPVRQEQAQGILVAALGVLAGHLGYKKAPETDRVAPGPDSALGPGAPRKSSASQARSAMISCRRTTVRPKPMRRLLGILFVAWALAPSAAGACGLSGPWYVSSEDGYTGIFIIEKVIDESSCEARLTAFSPLGESAVEACRVLRSDKVVIYCEVMEASQFFWTPDNFILDDRGEVLEGRWISDISAYVEFTKQ